MEEINDLSKEIGFNNLTYQYKDNFTSKKITDFKDLIIFFEDIKDGCTTLKKVE